MLPTRHRLDLRRSLPFYTFPQKAHTGSFSIYWEKDDTLIDLQAAVVVPKKVAPTAVLRNKIKRALRANLFSLFPTLPTNIRLVILVRRKEVLSQRDLLAETLKKNLL